MSYLDISQAAWTLVLSKDPRIKPKPATPEAASSNWQDTAGEAENITTTAATQQQTSCSSTTAATNMRNSVCMNSKDALTHASREAANNANTSKARDSQSKACQQQLKPSAAEEDTPSLPLELKLEAAAGQVQPPAAWSPCSGEQPSSWLLAAHGPAWQQEAAAAARLAAAAHRHLLGLLEKRRAALLKELGRARDLDLKRLLQLVATYTDDVQALLESGQESALCTQQDYMRQLTATAAAAVGDSTEAALQAAHKQHQQQISMMKQSEAAKLESARLSAKQQLTAALELQQQQATQQLEQQAKQLNDSWCSMCTAAEAASKKDAALCAHAETECTKLRAELASAKREAANWRSRWEKSASGNMAGTSSISGFILSSAGSISGALDVASDLTAAASGGLMSASDAGTTMATSHPR